MTEIKTGVYRHFKGGTAFVYEVATPSEDGACPRVGYIGLQNGKIYSRPVDNFLQQVTNAEGKVVPRFSLVEKVEVDVTSLVPDRFKTNGK